MCSWFSGSVIIVLERLLSKIIDVEVCRNMGGGADVPTHVLLIRIFKTCGLANI